jgi:hypothetical protein
MAPRRFVKLPPASGKEGQGRHLALPQEENAEMYRAQWLAGTTEETPEENMILVRDLRRSEVS